MMVSPIITGACRTLNKRLWRVEDLEIEVQAEIIKIPSCCDRLEYYEWSWGLEVIYSNSDACERLSLNAGVKNTQVLK